MAYLKTGDMPNSEGFLFRAFEAIQALRKAQWMLQKSSHTDRRLKRNFLIGGRSALQVFAMKRKEKTRLMQSLFIS